MIYIIFVFILGLFFGSFINVIIYRLNTDYTWWQGFSACPDCKHRLNARDLVPIISYFLLGAKCRYCQKPISKQYPLVELITGLLFALFYWRVIGLADPFNITNGFIWLLLAKNLLVVVFMIIVFVYDLKHFIILDKVVLAGVLSVSVINVILGYSVSDMLVGALLIFSFFGLQYYISKGRWIGGGDVKYGLLIGVILGWQQAILAVLLAYWLGALIAGVLILQGRKTLMDKVPFGTFLSVGVLISLYAGERIIKWYIGLV